MSRVGKRPIAIPDKVRVIVDERVVRAEGPKGQQALTLPQQIDVRVTGQQVELTCPASDARSRSLYGLSRTLVANLVLGVSQGFRRELEIEGLGYRAQVQGKTLTLQLGFSHPVTFPIPSGITIETPKPTQLVILGMDKRLVGQVAADLRAMAPPEPYKGKGVHYVGEVIRRKVGKAAAATK